ncbi:hypothetical protein SKAU_G00328660 [Synaphobranchus kaupii]|uniref:Uncharacterized protein n=1 Tax=Synaphobranchus kaupii TaxID=118154 RepID=A0A9Q1EQ37_SYNKA|nr:hypothetical protein SKAU_G00328660 [Synaphobranchus kaupii]
MCLSVMSLDSHWLPHCAISPPRPLEAGASVCGKGEEQQACVGGASGPSDSQIAHAKERTTCGDGGHHRSVRQRPPDCSIYS